MRDLKKHSILVLDYSITQNKFSVNTLNGRIKVSYQSKAMEKYFDGSWQFGTANLVSKLGKWFLHIPMTKELGQLQNSNINNAKVVFFLQNNGIEQLAEKRSR